MWDFIGTAGLIGVLITIVGTLTMFLKKNPIWKKWGLALLVSFLLLFIGYGNAPLSPETVAQEKMLSQVQALITEGKYADALAMAEKADQTSSSMKSEEMLRRCKELIVSQKAYENGLAALKANQLPDAFIAFGKVIRTDAINYGQAIQNIKELSPKLYQEANDLYNESKYEKSQEILKQILVVQPDFKAARELNISCNNAIKEKGNLDKAINIVAKLPDYKDDRQNLYASQIKDNIYEVKLAADFGSGLLTTLNAHLVDIKKGNVIMSLHEGDKFNDNYEKKRNEYSGKVAAETKAQTPSKGESREQFISKCQTINYNAWLRNPEQYENVTVTYTGYVNQVLESETILGKTRTDLLLNIGNTNSGEQLLYIKYTLAKGEQRILEGDTVQIWGIVNGREELTMTTGENRVFPVVDAKYYNFISKSQE